MNIDDAFPSKFIKASEVPEEGVTLVIERVEMEDVDGKGARKPVLYFRNAKKGLPLNKTNSNKIKQLFGTQETDQWIGRPITLYRSETDFQGDTVDCTRVRAAKNGGSTAERRKPALVPPPAPPDEEVTNDDIPF